MAFTTLTRRSGGPYDPDDLTREINENFDKCAEVSLATVADGELLVYDGSSGVWINRTPSELGISIDELSDVTVATPVDNDILLYDASSNTWLNVTGSAFASNINLDDIGNVSVSTLADGEVLVWDSSSNSWVNAANTATVALNDVTDVSISTPADGEVLTYDSSSGTWINAASLATDTPERNILTNGDMAVAQRGTSTTGVTTTGYYACDRWNFSITTLGTWTIAQDTDVPSGQGFASSLKATVTTADGSPAAGDLAIIQQKLEGQDVQMFRKGTASAKAFKVSFWAKSNTTGTYIAELVDADNTRQVSQSFTIDAADTWENKTITFPADTTGAFDNDNAESLSLNIWLGSGTTYTSGTLNTTWAGTTNANRAVGQTNLSAATSNYINLTGVKLEPSAFTPWDFEPFGENLRRCQRYYCKSYDYETAPGTASATSGRISWIGYGTNFFHLTHKTFPVSMRDGPTVTLYSPVTGASDKIRNETGGADVNGIAEDANEYGASLVVNNVSLTDVFLRDHFTADAEL